jgi:hypothetical protein
VPTRKQDVLWLDVAMDDPHAVCIGESVRHLLGDLQRILERQLGFALQPITQRIPLNVGHHVVEQSAGFT